MCTAAVGGCPRSDTSQPSLVISKRIGRKHSLYEILFLACLSLWVLPSGSLAGLPIKATLYLFTLSILLAGIIKNSCGLLYKSEMYLVCAILPLVLWSAIGVVNGFWNGVKGELSSFASLISIVLIAAIFSRRYCTRRGFGRARSLLYATTLVYVGFKLVIELLFVLRVVDFAFCIHIFRNVLNGKTMFLLFDVGGVSLCRIETANDAVPFVVFGIDLMCERRPVVARALEIGCMAFFALIVYSRVYILQFALTLLFALFLRVKDKGGSAGVAIALAMAGIAAFLLLDIGLAVPQFLDEALQARFSGRNVDSSDGIRVLQAKDLIEGFLRHPLFGNGLGATIAGSSSPSGASSYELEYLSFFFKFGLVGFASIIIPLAAVFFNESVGKTTSSKYRSALLFGYTMWLVRPLVNPHFLSGASGMVIVCLILFKHCYFDQMLPLSRIYNLRISSFNANSMQRGM